jgi:hypothetical protein
MKLIVVASLVALLAAASATAYAHPHCAKGLHWDSFWGRCVWNGW